MKTINGATLFAILACFSAPALAVTQGGHGPGNGGDGLDLDSSNNRGSIVVPVPGALQKTASLEVVGTPGQGQDKKGSYCSYSKSSAGLPVRASRLCKEFTLGKRVSLTPGSYLVGYEKSWMRLEIAPGEQSTVKLASVQVPKLNGSFKFEVFIDTTDKDVADLYLAVLWTIDDMSTYRQDCDISGIDNAFQNVCQIMLEGNDYRAMLGHKYWFGDDASYMEFGFEKTKTISAHYGDLTDWRFVRSLWKNYGRIVVSDPKDGDSISVLPGVYGVTFTNSDGQSATQYGIKAQ